MADGRTIQRAVAFALVLMCGVTAWGQEFSGGTGTPDDPYLIATAQDLIDLGNTPEIYDQHFRLTADIDLAAYTFERAVIAPGTGDFSHLEFPGTAFSGAFDGDNHVIRNLRIEGGDYLGLFGGLAHSALVRNVGLEDCSIRGIDTLGALAGYNIGTLSRCYSSGAVTGDYGVGGLVGNNDGGRLSECHSTGELTVRWDYAGGLLGSNSGTLWKCHSTANLNSVEGFHLGGLAGSNGGSVMYCYSTGAVTGGIFVGGLIGYVWKGHIWQCYSTGPVTAWDSVGGLVGSGQTCNVSCCYSTGTITGHDNVGGLVGVNGSDGTVLNSYSTGPTVADANVGVLVGDTYGRVEGCFWDTETSGLTSSAGGVGLTTVQMQAVETYLEAGWDFTDERDNGTAETWQMPEAGGYPQLSLFEGREPAQPDGEGTPAAPFLITNEHELGSVEYRPFASYRLETDIDLAGITWSLAPIPWSAGHFDGNGHVISQLNIRGTVSLGLFGMLTDGTVVSDLGLEDVSVEAAGDWIGALAGESQAVIVNCYTVGTVVGGDVVGGLVGASSGSVSNCYHLGAVSGIRDVGGLLGTSGGVANCFSSGPVTQQNISGRGNLKAGGVVGDNYGSVVNCFWDKETSPEATGTHGGVGLTTVEMQDPQTFLAAGWDFVGESGNGTTETWQMPPTPGYPRLSVLEGYEPGHPEGQGTASEPFLITNAQELGMIGYRPLACYRLETDMDLTDVNWSVAPVGWFAGDFDGNGYVIRGLHVQGASLLGLFGLLDSSATVTNLSLEDASIQGTNRFIGSLAGCSDAALIDCHATGTVAGAYRYIGGLVGYNRRGSMSDCSCTGTVAGGDWGTGGLLGANAGRATDCYSTAAVSGEHVLGGLVGVNWGDIAACYSTGDITGSDDVGGLAGSNSGGISNCFSNAGVTGSGRYAGGLVGENHGDVSSCYSTGAVTADERVGGLIGSHQLDSVRDCYSIGPVVGNEEVGGLLGTNSDHVTRSVWDVESSGITTGAGGSGLTTAEMMDPEWIGLQGWADNPNWTLAPHQDYPRLAWEDTAGLTIPEPVVDWLAGAGTSEAPYEIENADQLIGVGKAGLLRQRCIMLVADLDLADLIWPRAALPDFSGTFDGNGHTIRNLSIAGNADLGFIGRLEDGGAILNLHLLDVDIAGIGDDIGGLIGYVGHGQVVNCHTSGQVTGNWYVGGLIGNNDHGNVSDCDSDGTISGRKVGGLIGHNHGYVSYCHSSGMATARSAGVGGLIALNTGNVSHSSSRATVKGALSAEAGGLIESNWGTVSHCYSTGTVTGDRMVGGLVASNRYYGTSISNCYSTGAVFTERGWSAGGLVGENNNASISGSYSTSTVTGRSEVGGLVGSNYYGSVSDCYCTGTVTGSDRVGGLVGSHSVGRIEHCYSTTRVVGSTDIGGLVGRASASSAVEQSFWDIETSGQTTSPLGIGLPTAEMQDLATYLNAGWDFIGETANGVEDLWRIDDGQDYPHLWWELLSEAL